MSAIVIEHFSKNYHGNTVVRYKSRKEKFLVLLGQMVLENPPRLKPCSILLNRQRAR